ncbi:unnamed protein product [Sphagnum balticum]
MSDNTDKRTATQRIEDLEKVLAMVCNGLNQLQGAVQALFQSQNELGPIKTALKILDRKTDGIVHSASADGGITFAAIKKYVEDLNIQDLKKMVADYLAAGKVVPTDVVAGDSFLVCEEYQPDGTLQNPRVQFRMDAQEKSTTDLLTGKKVGDLVSLGESEVSLKILELYTITPEKAPETPAPPAPAPEAATPATDTANSEASQAAPAATEATPAPAAPTGPSNANFESAPAETPVTNFVSDAGSVAPAASS